MDAAVEMSHETPGDVWIPSGVAVAALLAAVIGLLVLGLVNIISAIDAGFRTAITLNTGIGPYSGKEVIAFSAWLGGWLILHVALRKRELNMRRWYGVFLVSLLVAVLLVWPPVFEAIAELF